MQRSRGSESYFLVAAASLGGCVSGDLAAALSRHPWSDRRPLGGLLLHTASRKRDAATETARRGQVGSRASPRVTSGEHFAFPNSGSLSFFKARPCVLVYSHRYLLQWLVLGGVFVGGLPA